MNPTNLILLSILLLFGCKKESGLILENARIVNLENGEIGSYNLLIRENVIERITEESIHGYQKIDLEGKYLIPFLWDMHVHLHADKSKLLSYFNQGVLGLRDLGAFEAADVDSLIKWKRLKQDNRALKLPDIEYVGLINNDTSCFHGHRHIGNSTDLKNSYSYMKAVGSSYYKIHNCFPSDLLPELDSLLGLDNLVFGGHIPEGMDPIQYVKQFDNINSIEHISVILRALSFRQENALSMMEAVNLLDGGYLDSLAVIMKEKNIAFVPNLLSEVSFIKTYPAEQQHLGEALLKRYQNYVKRISDHGVILLTGTDKGLNADDDMTVYEELALLSQAGLSALQVLQSATINANIAMDKPLNLIHEKMEANFIILKDNPLKNLSTLKSVYGVVHYGYYTKIEAAE